MKQIDLVFMFMILMFTTSSCTQSETMNPAFQTEEYLAQYDMKNEYTQAQGMIDKENGIYYFCPLGSVYVYYYDEETDIQGKLCAKPECTHEDASCNAYLGVSNIGIQIYDHSLYWIQGGSLYRMDLNGENHARYKRLRKSAAQPLCEPRNG